ncbi:MAG: carbon-nitrogen hydrolase family protein [Elusimicrobia bacterium]|nr:carbon-nitrogen hydrolase family protein [Elusimicrobiota bacterium]
MSKHPLYLHPVSLDLIWNDPAKNIFNIKETLRKKLAQFPSIEPQEQLFILPELTLTGFVTQNPRSFLTNPPSPEIQELAYIASELSTGLVVGFPETNPSNAPKPFNAAALFGSDGKIMGTYRKMHLFTSGAAPESLAYAPGEYGCLIQYRGWNIGLAICFDLRFPQLFIEYSRAAADAIVIPSCWVAGPYKSEQFKILSQAYAILTQAYVASVNRSGKDPNFAYHGSAYVFGPVGEDLTNGLPCELKHDTINACRALPIRLSDRREGYKIKII